ncbi:cytochrome c biogenesis protein ResB, partial [Dissulfurirhabdus thermomarina]
PTQPPPEPAKSLFDRIYDLFSSLRLAIFLLIALAVASIIGTLLPQGKDLAFYGEHFPRLLSLIRVLDLGDMYHSWWFLALMGLFALNLVTCTIRRLPVTLRLYRRDSLALDPDRLARMSLRHSWVLHGNPGGERAAACFRERAGRTRTAEIGGGTLHLVEHGRWTYWALYGLHASILVIFLGALVGWIWGFHGDLLLMEGDTADSITNRRGGAPIPLGFQVRCDDFDVSFYETGAPKEYRSDLTVIDGGREVLHRSVVVNRPLTYKGITFYQANYQAAPEAAVRIEAADGATKTLVVPAYQTVTWPEKGISLRLIQYMPNVHGGAAVRLLWADRDGPLQGPWLIKGRPTPLTSGDKEFSLSLIDLRQRFMTGLSVKKDPGVWIVWLGCTGLILGFVVVFWVGHRRLWLWVGPRDGKTVAVLAGQTNKNKTAFEDDFHRIVKAMDRCLEATP